MGDFELLTSRFTATGLGQERRACRIWRGDIILPRRGTRRLLIALRISRTNEIDSGEAGEIGSLRAVYDSFRSRPASLPPPPMP